MLNMKAILVFLTVAAVAQAALEWDTLQAKWSPLALLIRTNSYFDLPKTQTAAETAAWVQVTETQNEFGDSPWCEANDPRICLYYDVSGNIYGIQAAIPTAELEYMQTVYPFADMEWYGTATLFGEECWVTTVYTRNPEDIAAGTASESDGLIGVGNLWIREYKSESYHYVSGNASTLNSEWIEEACIPMMGLHYYKDMYTDSPCTDFKPWFLLYQNGQLTGMGYQAFGEITEKGRNWHEQVPAIAIKSTVPTAPDCLTDWASDYSVISVHFYFTAKAWTTTC